ncbi:MAG: hypothetical protein Q7S53_03520 [bacterium]|nr:hypothetical protein [bacterium]
MEKLVSEPQNSQEFRYIKIQLPSRCAVCDVTQDFSWLKQKCGEVLFGPHLSTVCGKVEEKNFDQVIAAIRRGFIVEEISENEYAAFSWGL